MGLTDLAGQRFGLLTAIQEAGRDSRGAITWLCKCDCGSDAVKAGSDLRKGHIKSCGCAAATHRQSKTALYRRWASMIQRTTNPANKEYANYGGRGVTVCAEWRSFEGFARDMGSGFSPELSLERIDNNLGYEPGNCRWATAQEQARNRRNSRLLTYRGETRPMVEWCELLGVSYGTVTTRLRLGWSAERALTSPPDLSIKQTNRYLTFCGRTWTIREWSRRLGINASTIQKRLKRGWPVERALTEGVSATTLAQLDADTDVRPGTERNDHACFEA